MKIQRENERISVEVYVSNGQLPSILTWFESQRCDGTLTAILERGIIRTYTVTNGTMGRPQDKSLSPTQCTQYKTAEYSWQPNTPE